MLNMESFIDWVKKHKIKTITIIIIAFIGPLIVVHFLFKWNTGYDFISAEWSAGDLIGYVAGFEAFTGSIILGIIAVWQTEKANNTNDRLLQMTGENERKSVLPFLSFNLYITKYEGEILSSMLARTMQKSKIDEDANILIPIEDTLKREDLLISELDFTISHESIKARAGLTEKQKKKINSQFGIKKKENSTKITDPDYFYLDSRI